jgi:hypothetical protein
VRTYDEAVDVHGDAEGAAPRQFLWRDRLYVVRDVLSHWYERSAWWDGAAARTLLGEADAVARAGDPGVAGAECEVWRVEASAGRSAGSGVYDLSVTVPAPQDLPRWRLVRVVD